MSGMVTRSRAFCVDALKVFNNVAKQQFTVSLAKDTAVLDYEKINANTIILHNTLVPDSFQGKGVGKLLAQYAFDHAREMKLDVVCKCHFLAKFYENNIDKYKDLNVKIELEDE